MTLPDADIERLIGGVAGGEGGEILNSEDGRRNGGERGE